MFMDTYFVSCNIVSKNAEPEIWLSGKEHVLHLQTTIFQFPVSIS